MLAASTRSGIITPLGSLVEPEVYCKNARSLPFTSGRCQFAQRRQTAMHQHANIAFALTGDLGNLAVAQTVHAQMQTLPFDHRQA